MQRTATKALERYDECSANAGVIIWGQLWELIYVYLLYTTLLCSELNPLLGAMYFSEEIFTVSWSRKLEHVDIPSRKCPKHKVWLALVSYI